MSSVILKMLSSRPRVDMTMSVKRDCGNTAKFGVLVSKKARGIPNCGYRDDNNRGLSEYPIHFDVPYFSAAHSF